MVIKFLKPEYSEDSEALLRFEREAKVIASLKHKNIVSCFGYGVWANRMPYLAMEYLEGESLRDMLRSGEPLSWGKAFHIGEQVCNALYTAHQQGILHRDVKPENIFFTLEGEVKLLDFGLAHVDDQNQKLTRTGALIGSAMYMSPEQARGQPAIAQSDIYSLACVLYEAIGGRPVFDCDDAIGLINMHAYEYPEPLRQRMVEMPEHVDQVLFKALSKDPSARYDDARSFGLDLGATSHTQLIASDFSVPVLHGQRSSRWRVWWLTAAVASPLLLVAAAITNADRILPQLLNSMPTSVCLRYAETLGDVYSNRNADLALTLYRIGFRNAKRKVDKLELLNKVIALNLSDSRKSAALNAAQDAIDLMFDITTDDVANERDAEVINRCIELQNPLRSDYGERASDRLRDTSFHFEEVFREKRLISPWCERLSYNTVYSTSFENARSLIKNTLFLESHFYLNGYLNDSLSLVKQLRERLPGQDDMAISLRKILDQMIEHGVEMHKIGKPLVETAYPWILKGHMSRHQRAELFWEAVSAISSIDWSLYCLRDLVAEEKIATDNQHDRFYWSKRFVHSYCNHCDGKFEQSSEESVDIVLACPDTTISAYAAGLVARDCLDRTAEQSRKNTAERRSHPERLQKLLTVLTNRTDIPSSLLDAQLWEHINLATRIDC